ncbi:hypothetical protein EVAR_2854_1 [Eumeta japonica]|uniref:Uncharacterized protein n=1 Tax=Eumeta variegata TaxID=151549 RepID=A0A4C1T1M6_EUMVA|nr:hypothetical protein EVAR_2854_1 [Eumeta japonica]
MPDDKVIFYPSACEQQEMVNKMNDFVKKMGSMKRYVGKTKVMVFERSESTTECDILIEDDLNPELTRHHVPSPRGPFSREISGARRAGALMRRDGPTCDNVHLASCYNSFDGYL